MAVIDLNSLVGGKAWYKSMTVWGLLTLAMGEKAVSLLCGDPGILPAPVCGPLTGIVNGLGIVLTGLGIRRKLPA